MSALDALIFGIRKAFFGGVELASSDSIEFKGSGVSAAYNATTKRLDVTVAGGGASGGSAGLRVISSLPATLTSEDVGKRILVGVTADGTLAIPDVMTTDQSMRFYNATPVDGVLVTLEAGDDVTLLYPSGVPVIIPRSAYAEVTALDDNGNYFVTILGVPESVDLTGQSTIYRSVVQVITEPTTLLTIEPNTIFGSNQSIMLEIDYIVRADGVDGSSPDYLRSSTVGKTVVHAATDDSGSFVVQGTTQVVNMGSPSGESVPSADLLLSEDESGNLVISGSHDSARSGWSLKIKATSYALEIVEGEET